jgi:hypothetical protein
MAETEATPAVVVPTEAPVPAAPAVPTEDKAPAVPAQTEVQKVEAAVKAIEAKVVKFAEGARVEISVEEKFFVTKMENEFLKSQLEIQRLTKIVENTQKQYVAFLEGLTKKYAINPLTHMFNNIELVFTKKA